MTCRKRRDDVKTGVESLLRDQRGGDPLTARVASGMKVARVRSWLERGTWEPVASMPREQPKWKTHEGQSTDAGHRGGGARSSGEGPVMGLERRGPIILSRRGVNPAMGRNCAGRRSRKRLGDKSRMSREAPVRFREGLGVKLPRATRRNVYVRSKAAGERVLTSLTRFLEGVLRLRVNREKSAVAYIEERKFLGYRLLSGGRLGIAPKSLDRAKDRIRQITRRNRGVSVGQMTSELNSFLTGWVTYFRLAACKSHLTELDGWVRRKLRCVRLKQCKRTKALADFFRRHGVLERTSWTTALSGKGWWRLAGSPAANQAMDQRWFDSLGLVNLLQKYATLQR